MGHNGGPTMERGHGWRRHAWKASRAALMPKLPLEVLRRRLRRAGELGLDYSTYASFRASGGDDIVAILFSSNALRLLRPADPLPADRAARLAAIRACGRGLLATPPLPFARLADTLAEAGAAPDIAAQAPGFAATWAEMRAALDAARAPGWPASRVILVGDTAFERDWSAAGRFAGYLSADRYFPTQE